MSRTTQYIGLTNDARNYVKNAISIEQYEMTTGMFNEPVMGNIYYLPPLLGLDKELIAKEVVQFTPWSSGPMIFTHLQFILVKEDNSKCDCGYYYSWVQNPLITNEFDVERGHCYV